MNLLVCNLTATVAYQREKNVLVFLYPKCCWSILLYSKIRFLMKTICLESRIETHLKQKLLIKLKKCFKENTMKHLKVVCIKIKTILEQIYMLLSDNIHCLGLELYKILELYLIFLFRGSFC